VTDERKTEAVGPYRLVAAFHEGAYRGVLWHEGKKVASLVGASIDDAFLQLREKVEAALFQRAQARGYADPSHAATIAALTRLFPRLAVKHIAMLKAHFDAPGQRITATQLARAADYENHSAANLQYGRVGWLFFGELPVVLPIRKSNGKPIYTCSLAEGDDQRTEDESQWAWKLKPHVTQALAALKFARYRPAHA